MLWTDGDAFGSNTVSPPDAAVVVALAPVDAPVVNFEVESELPSSTKLSISNVFEALAPVDAPFYLSL